MKLNTKWFATAVAITGGVALAGSAKADAVLDTFINTGLGSPLAGSWATPATTVTPTANGLDVSATGLTGNNNYGSGYQGVTGAPVDATGDLYVNLTFTIVSSTPGIFEGPTVDLIDGASHDALYNNWYNSYTPGQQYTVSALISSGSGAGSLDKSTLSIFRIGIDPAADTAYDILYQGLSVTAAPAPEPCTFALMGLGAAGLLIARRRLA